MSTVTSARRESKQVRAVMLYFRLNADALLYTPLSHRGSRAARLLSLLCPLFQTA